MMAIQDYDLRLTPHVHNGVVYVNLPKNFCKVNGIKGDGEEVRLVIHQVITTKDDIYQVNELCDLRIIK